jgi:hypothetical protein
MGRVFPDPQSQASCPGGPCSPHRQGNVPATRFLGYRVAAPTRVSVVVLRGKRVVRRWAAATRRGETTYRLRLPARGLRAGDYKVRVTAGTGRRTVTRTLVARRL